MKKNILCLAALAGAASLAQATLIFSDSFTYDDGALTAASSGVWTNHSSTANQVDVTGGVVNLSQNESEDVSAGLPGGPISSGKLYASFKVNFSALPGGNGTYFFHFRDLGTSNFRGKVFASSTNSGAGFFRLGVAVGGKNDPALIPMDLALGAEYKVVLRYDIDTTNATLWINPPSESSVVNRADATDTTSTKFGYYSVCFRQAGTTPGIGVMTFDDLKVGTEFADVQTVGGPPTISGVNDQHIAANTSAGPLSFSVDDVETAPGSLVVTATSDNNLLVPNDPANLTLGGSGTNRFITVTPVAGQQGSATIQVAVTDGNNDTSTTTFKIYVGEPTISAIPNQLSPTNTVLGPIAFTVGDAETPGSLTITKASSNPGVVLDDSIQILGSGASRSVRLTPNPDTAGSTTITLTVNDGTFSISTSFTVTFYPKLGLLINEPFAYPDGSLVTNSATWTSSSGTNGDALVTGGKLGLTFARSEDVSINFPSLYIDQNSGVVLYSSFKVNFSALPGSGGQYFAHYRDSGSNFRARVFATTAGAAVGKFRITIANVGFATAAVPQDLSTNTTYLVLTRYNVGTGESKIWVNPVSEAVDGVSAVDTTAPVTLYYFNFRQDSGIGTMTVDDLKIGTQWSDVWEAVAPAPEAIKMQQLGNDLVLSWSNPSFTLQSAVEAAGPYTTIAGAASPYTNTLSGGPLFFRLKY